MVAGGLPLACLMAAARFVFLLLCTGACSSPPPSRTPTKKRPTPGHSEEIAHQRAEPKAEPPHVQEPRGRVELSNATPRTWGHFERLDDTEPGSIVWVPHARAPGSKRQHQQTWPLLVSTHGAGGGPVWHCDFWSRVVTDRAFVLCLQGKAMGTYEDAYYYPDHHQQRSMLARALDALDQRHAARLQPAGNTFVGYSQGATMGSLMIHDFGQRFTRLLLIEGGFQYWSVRAAQRFAAAGGQRVLFVCGTSGCQNSAKQAARWLLRADVQARVEYARGAGHTPAGSVGDLAQQGLPWLLEEK